MPKIEWKSAAIGAVAVYAFLWYRAKKASTTSS
ncbi:hypothetical protein AWB76_04087 [Caballeronia temeraria]|uniref:Uncharacterized protein n=1 Tax=Caballeronia temeraria TaxID=1777137 RepID=A0A158BE40_9BURK|nr:hypothetical protein AWB76_04087 [Caballeronia temeraria]